MTVHSGKLWSISTIIVLSLGHCAEQSKFAEQPAKKQEIDTQRPNAAAASKPKKPKEPKKSIEPPEIAAVEEELKPQVEEKRRQPECQLSASQSEIRAGEAVQITIASSVEFDEAIIHGRFLERGESRVTIKPDASLVVSGFTRVDGMKSAKCLVSVTVLELTEYVEEKILSLTSRSVLPPHWDSGDRSGEAPKKILVEDAKIDNVRGIYYSDASGQTDYHVGHGGVWECPNLIRVFFRIEDVAFSDAAGVAIIDATADSPIAVPEGTRGIEFGAWDVRGKYGDNLGTPCTMTLHIIREEYRPT